MKKVWRFVKAWLFMLFALGCLFIAGATMPIWMWSKPIGERADRMLAYFIKTAESL